jgi:hypothetical protein
MNTGLRRFILRLAIGLLAFLLGVAAAWALGGLNPFQNSSGAGSYRKRCGSYRSWSSTPTESSLRAETDGRGTRHEGHACKTKRIFRAIPPPPPAPVAPVD